MAQIVLERVSKYYGDVPVVRELSLTIHDKEFLILIGPSGCGKTTTLRMVAGLERISSGVVRIGGRIVNDVPAKDRDVAMVFQNYGLYPHMSVYGNMAFGLQMRKVPKPEIHSTVTETAQFLGIRELLDRKPRQLSGGQRQRVALGRAIVRKPQLFLFDEPLSNLDAQLRVDMRTELKKLHQRLQATMVYVTHDQTEAMTMADRIVIMKDGLIQQIGAPMDVYKRPANRFVAAFIGSPSMNFIECRIEARDGRLFFAGPGLSIAVPDDRAGAISAYVDKPITLGIRPEDLQQEIGASAPDTTIDARVDVVEPLGHETLLDMSAGPTHLIARCRPTTDVYPGQSVRLQVNTAQLHAFDAVDGRAIA